MDYRPECAYLISGAKDGEVNERGGRRSSWLIGSDPVEQHICQAGEEGESQPSRTPLSLDTWACCLLPHTGADHRAPGLVTPADIQSGGLWHHRQACIFLST